MDLAFHIVFGPGSVRYLRLAVMSLLRFSTYRYRLVANGLNPRELAELRAFCRISPRLELLPFPTRSMLPHGVMLSLLQARETGSHFCFMDSDIFATAPFQEALEEQLADCDVLSSCRFMSMGTTVPESQVGFGATSLETPNGLSLATSFFAVYRQDVLRRVIVGTGVGFEDYTRGQLSDPVVARLGELGVDAGAVQYLDTGKLLNVLSHAYGARFRHRELDGLTHIGSLTLRFNPGWFLTLRRPGWFVTLRLNPAWMKERLTAAFRFPYVLGDGDLGRVKGDGSRPQPAAPGVRGRRDGDARLRRQRIRSQHGIAEFFVFFLRSLVDGTPEPRLGVSDPELRGRIAGLCAAIRETYEECERPS
jgi:hypothetical protein